MVAGRKWGLKLRVMKDAREKYFVLDYATKTCFHRSNEPQALTTHSQPILALVIWRGSGLSHESSLLVHK